MLGGADGAPVKSAPERGLPCWALRPGLALTASAMAASTLVANSGSDGSTSPMASQNFTESVSAPGLTPCLSARRWVSSSMLLDHSSVWRSSSWLARASGSGCSLPSELMPSALSTLLSLACSAETCSAVAFFSVRCFAASARVSVMIFCAQSGSCETSCVSGLGCWGAAAGCWPPCGCCPASGAPGACGSVGMVIRFSCGRGGRLARLCFPACRPEVLVRLGPHGRHVRLGLRLLGGAGADVRGGGPAVRGLTGLGEHRRGDDAVRLHAVLGLPLLDGRGGLRAELPVHLQRLAVGVGEVKAVQHRLELLDARVAVLHAVAGAGLAVEAHRAVSGGRFAWPGLLRGGLGRRLGGVAALELSARRALRVARMRGLSPCHVGLLSVR